MPNVHVHDCVFCRIVAGTIPCFKLYEDEATMAFLDINPVHPGHALVIAKTHAENLFEINEADLIAVVPVVKRLASAVNRVFQPDGINLHQANGPGAAQSVQHFHMHVVPRRLGDELIMNWPLVPGDKAGLQAAAEKLRAAMG